ncbi:glycerophosphoryl diester phosphodiesterase membrane domain-containing protein [Angustibacter sp. McL0619]|uniref:glycerophosphoryl diester phosphodiesterase membrane domain-containing protein n=1 Tax=Angustibacter sp. McL0619 TaxID=3415676 RepID=UPI003CED79C4
MVHPPGWEPPGADDQRSGGWGQPRYVPIPPSQGPPPLYGATPGYGPGLPPGQAWAPPTPGVVPLRPLGLGDVLDGAVRTMRHNPRVMFGLSALVMGIAVVLSTALLLLGLPQALDALDPANGSFGADQAADLVGAGVVAVIIPALVQGLALSVLNGILISAVSDAVIGLRPSTAEVIRRVGWRGVGRLVALTLLSSLLLLLALVVIALPVAGLYLLALPAGVLATVVGVPLAICTLVYLYIRLAFAAPAMLLERLGVWAALRRSWRLGTGSWWRVLGVLLLTGLIGWVASSLLQLPFGIIGELVGAAIGVGDDTSTITISLLVSSAVSNLGTVVSAAVVSPFGAAVVCLLYIDLRIRREGLDVALARAAANNASAQRAEDLP